MTSANRPRGRDGRPPAALTGFARAEVERAWRYQRPRYLGLLLDLALGLAVLAILGTSSLGDRLHGALAGLPWWGRAAAFTALVLAISAACRLPLALWRGHLHERRFGFSTQTVGAWAVDRAKAIGVSLTLTTGAVLGLVALARALPAVWPAAAAAAAAALVLLLGFVGPVLLEPLFNRFAPLAEGELAAELCALAARAGVTVRHILVADASRRTRKENAYVSGLGRTRRLVLYDTLLARSEPAGLRLVVAHELGHRRSRHVPKATLSGMAGAAGGVLVLWAVLLAGPVLDAARATGAGDPRIAPFLLLVAAVLELVALPLVSLLSRRWEREADRFALELTGDAATFEATHRALATSNLADLAPPRLLYLALFTHPTPPERIAAARRWQEERAAAGAPTASFR